MLTWNASVGHSFAATQHPDKHIRSGFLWLQIKVAYIYNSLVTGIVRLQVLHYFIFKQM